MLKGAERYEKLDFLGEGQYATVYKAKDLLDKDKIVAIKKIKAGTKEESRDGISRTALREIKLLQEIEHKHIIKLLDVYGSKSKINLVFEFMEFDLEKVIKDTSIVLTMSNIKSYLLQILRGLEFLHFNWILHRDLKPNNLLIDVKGNLKIGDFGLARYFGSPARLYTSQVVTRWYRCPELLYGANIYETAVDIWSVGCIAAELLLRRPFLPGDTDLDQLNKIFTVVGTPNEDNWPNHICLPFYVKYETKAPIPLETIFTAASDDLIFLLESMLALNPLNRCTAKKALQMEYFTNMPRPTAFDHLPRPSEGAKKEEEVKENRKRKIVDREGGPAKRLHF